MLTTQEVLNLKAQAETAIRLALNEFTTETGLEVNSIELAHHNEVRRKPWPVQRVLLRVQSL